MTARVKAVIRNKGGATRFLYDIAIDANILLDLKPPLYADDQACTRLANKNYKHV